MIMIMMTIIFNQYCLIKDDDDILGITSAG